MDGSLDEAKRPEPTPAAGPEALAARLSVVIDGRLDAARARQVATLTGRLGLAGVWLRHPWWPLSGTAARDTGVLATAASAAQVTLGLIVDASADSGESGGTWLDHLVPARIALTGTPAAVARWQDLIGRRPGLAVTALALALPARSAAVFVPCAPGRDLAAAVAEAACAAAGRPVLAEVTVSVGRTAAEARARADADELFTLAGHPAQQGLFGTLEECQDAAARLTHAGATELVCYLPLASDLTDVLAQLRSIAVGAGVLRPGEPPSAAPPPPASWGGRRITT